VLKRKKTKMLGAKSNANRFKYIYIYIFGRWKERESENAESAKSASDASRSNDRTSHMFMTRSLCVSSQSNTHAVSPRYVPIRMKGTWLAGRISRGTRRVKLVVHATRGRRDVTNQDITCRDESASWLFPSNRGALL